MLLPALLDRLSAVNAGIDLAQEAYAIGTKYLGRALTSAWGFPGAQDIKYLLDTKTNQLQVYSSANPQDKHSFGDLSTILGMATVGSRGASVNNSFLIQQGPGQDPRDTMSDAMFTIKSSGLGVFGYAK